MIDPTEFGKAMATIVQSAIAPLLKRIDDLEARQPERGEKGDPGKDAEPVDVDALVDAAVVKLLASDRIDTLADLKASEAVAKHFDAHPVRDGQDGRDGPQGASGERGEKGEPGKDGESVADLLIDRDGALVATFTDGRTKSLGVVIGRDGNPGRDGKDGADFSEAAIDYDGERTLTIRGKGGELVKRVPIPLDRGYWREGMKSEHGDILTHDGNAWIALKDTAAKPCHENKDDWRLFARKGRDGAQGPAGKDYKPPGPVKLDPTNG